MESLNVAASRALSPELDKSPAISDAAKAHYLEAARTLLGSYRTGEANDPEIYVAGVVRILSAYPLWVVRRVVDPLDGLAGQIEWLPKYTEIKKACETLHRPALARVARDKQVQEQLAERARIEALPKPKQTREEFLEEMERRGMPIDSKRRTIAGTAAEVKTKYGITDAQWDAIPDAPEQKHFP